MKKLFILIALTTLIQPSFGGLYNDSMYHIINNKLISGKEKLPFYRELLGKYVRLQPDDCLEIADAGIRLAMQENDSITLATLYRQKGVAFVTTGARDSAIFYYDKALHILEHSKDDNKKAEIYNDIARFYRKTEPDRAIGYYDEAMKLYKQADNAEGIATIYNESGVAFEYKGDLEEAIKRYEASLAIQKKRGDQVGIGYSLEFLSGAYLKKKEYALARKYIFDALTYREATKDTFALCINYTNIGDLLTETGNMEEAILYYLKSNDIAYSIRYLDIISYNYGRIAAAYEKLMQYNKAYDNLQQHIRYKDSLFNIEKNKQIEELSLKFETEKHKSRIRQQQFEISKRNYWIYSIIFLTIVSAFIAYLYYRRYRLKQQNKLQAAILEQQEYATRAVLEAEEEERQRIARDLHDGIGQMMSVARMNLSSFEDKMTLNEEEEQEFEKVKYLIDESCREIRNVSHNMMPNSLLKKSLASAVRDFIDKMDKKSIEIHLYTEGLDSRIDSNIETVFYRVIQECVNNVIKHSRASKLDISIMKEPDGITATIEDNGIGFDTSTIDLFEGIGLKNITSRVSYLKGTVDIDSAPGRGTLLAIYIPLQ